jgi:hypothetical protein
MSALPLKAEMRGVAPEPTMMPESRKGGVNDMILAVLHEIRAATLD